MRVEERSGGRVLVITTPAVQHPAVMLGVRISCGVEMRRDYTLLLNPPGETPAAQAVVEPPVLRTTPVPPTPSTPARMASAPGGSSLWETMEGESADSIAKALIPGNSAAQRRYAKAILSANRGLAGIPARPQEAFAPGTRLYVPAVPLIAANAAPPPSLTRKVLPSQEESRLSPAPRTERKAAPSRNRLLVTEGGEGSLQLSTSIGSRPELSEQERARLRSELQLIAVLDEKIAKQMELSERLRQLEALQQKLQADSARLEEQLRQYSAPATNSSAPPPSAAIVKTLPAPPAASDAPATVAKATSDSPPWYESSAVAALALALLALVLAAALWLLRRRRNTDSGFGASGDAESADASEALVEPLTIDDIWPEDDVQLPQGAKSGVAAMEGAIGPMSAARSGPLSLLQVHDDVEEHDSAVELAEIMMSFGRVQGAAQTLSDFIRTNPKQAVRPWIKLLEVYRVANMRMEFEALTAQLNKAFNVKSPSWEEIEVASGAPESLEGHPHILKTLCDAWGTQSCQAYLHNLLRDNRQGTRQGFPLAIVDEILLLLAILESRLGPYRHVYAADEAGEKPGDKPTKQPAAPTVIATPAVPVAVAPMAEPLVLETPPTASAGTIVLPDEDPLGEIDFNLDSTDLTRTLNINLDELTDFGDLGKEDERRR